MNNFWCSVQKKLIAEMSETADKNTFAGALAQEFSHFVTLSNYIIWASFCQQFFQGFSTFLQPFPKEKPLANCKDSTLFCHQSKNSIPISVNPCAGAVGPAASLSQASSISFTRSGGYWPLPTSMSVPAMILTIL